MFSEGGNKGIIALAEQLNKTKINQFYLAAADIDDSAGQALTLALATMPIKGTRLVGSQSATERYKH